MPCSRNAQSPEEEVVLLRRHQEGLQRRVFPSQPGESQDSGEQVSRPREPGAGWQASAQFLNAVVVKNRHFKEEQKHPEVNKY